MIQELSILIPTRNDICLPQVEALQRMASAIEGLHYEILVSDDASDDPEVIEQNAKINTLEHCSLLRQPKNHGRAANRNLLAQKAQFPWLLFLDCNVKIANERFLKTYLESDVAEVVNGGIFAETNPPLARANLRYMYEKKNEPKHTAMRRQQRPYQSFRTSNFMVRREVMLTLPFDENLTGYGYEDVLFGKSLCHHGIAISNIDNPVMITHFESNEGYVAKVEEAMHTLYTLRKDLSGYSPLLSTVDTLKKWHLTSLFMLFYKTFSTRIRKKLTGSAPTIKWLNPYKLGYYLTIETQSE